jgi:hypothetical protein
MMKFSEVAEYVGLPKSTLAAEVRDGRLIPDNHPPVVAKGFDPASCDRMIFSPQAVAVFMLLCNRPSDLINMLKGFKVSK